MLALGLVTFLAPQARAGTYTVPGCDGSGRIDGWVAAATPNSGTAYGDGCPGYPYSGGLLARSVGRADTSLAPHGSYASWTFRAPAGTHIAGFATYFRSYAKYPWVPGIRDPDSGRWLNCSMACPMMFPDWARQSYVLNQRAVSIATICWASVGCRRDADNTGWARLSHTSVVLSDDWLPSVAITGGTLVAGGWRRGVQSLSYSARDNTGIRTVRILVDGQLVGRSDLRCDPWAVIQCPNTARNTNIDTPVVFRKDGKHVITVEATDGGRNVARASRTLYTDNTAPAQPRGLALAGGSAWRSVNRFAASWGLPTGDGGSPLAGVSYELCPTAGTQNCVRGARAGTDLTSVSDLSVPHDGSWTLRLWLRDQAGNEDRDRSVTAGPLRLDAVPPSVKLLPRDPNRPAQLDVQAADVVSGVASVAIEVHRRGSAAWHPLPVLRNGSRFSAPVDDETLAAGTYDIRARAVDGAGNERTTAQDGSGKAATIVLPARLKSSLNVGREVRRGRQLRLDPTTVVPFGSRVRLRGRLTGPGGNPVQNTQVDVWQRSALEGSEFKRLGIVITGPQGGFNFRVPAGTSRIIRFRYAGTALQRGFTRDVRVDVHATTTIGIDSRSAVNGDYVTFRGQLRGRPFPAGGKLVELQVFTRRRWRTFAQPRASSRTGRWSFAYRFEAISGSVTFRFRARIRREAVYPYETGTSRQIRVRVRGL